MKLSKKIKKRLSNKLILRVNELYHDFENRVYNDRQAFWFEEESERWKKKAQDYIWNEKPKTCLDYGSGTGFVPKILATKLKKTDKLICTDISQEMLNICQTDILKLKTECEIDFLKTEGTKIPVSDNSVDIITMNSVLHHLLDIDFFFKECARVLKKTGLVIILHEPNGETKLPFHYRINEFFLTLFYNPMKLIFRIIEKNPLLEVFLRKILNKISSTYQKRNIFLNQISEILIKEKFVDFKLNGSEIQQLVDIQTEFGFEKQKLKKTFGGDFDILKWETFNYIDLKSQKKAKRFNVNLQDKFPEKGKSLSFILQKKG